MEKHFVLDGARGSRRAVPSSLRRAFAAALLGLAACVPASELAEDVDVELAFEPAPHVGHTLCTIHLTDPTGTPVTGAEVEIEGNMNHAGMVPVFGVGHEAAPGAYEAPLEFTMGGDWFVIVRAELSDGRELEQVLDLPAVPTKPDAAPSCCTPESR